MATAPGALSYRGIRTVLIRFEGQAGEAIKRPPLAARTRRRVFGATSLLFLRGNAILDFHPASPGTSLVKDRGGHSVSNQFLGTPGAPRRARMLCGTFFLESASRSPGCRGAKGELTMRSLLILVAICFSGTVFAQSAPPKVGNKPLVQLKPKAPMGCKLVGTVRGTKLWAGDCVGSEVRDSTSTTETQALPEQATRAITPDQKE